MQTVDCIRCNIDSRIETKSYIRSPDVIIDRLGHTDNIQAESRKHTGSLLRTVSTDTDQAI